MEQTDNGIEYEWELAGPGGARFWLKPIKGVHTDTDVKIARSQIKRDRDVMGLYVEWQAATPEIATIPMEVLPTLPLISRELDSFQQNGIIPEEVLESWPNHPTGRPIRYEEAAFDIIAPTLKRVMENHRSSKGVRWVPDPHAPA